MTMARISRRTGTAERKSAMARLGVLLVALQLLALACSGSGTAVPVTAEMSTSAPVPPSDTSSANCENPYLQVVEGATFTRLSTSSAGETTQTATIKDVTQEGFSVERTGVLSGGRAYTLVEYWSCADEGLIQAPSDELAAIATGSKGTVTVQTISNEGVTLPKDVKAGDDWVETFNVDVTGTDATSNWTVTYSFAAIGQEKVTVPAGTFMTMKLTNRISWPNSGMPDMDVAYWFAEGVGLVKTAFSWGGVDAGTSELISYHIP